MAEYRVNLDIYDGPMDLLLYLIRREEVDIHDIPIARIAGQYVAHVEMLKKLDPNMAGDFLVLAATLMEIKTRMLLPVTEIEEGSEEGLELDPRADLVRQLLQYKAFKDAAADLQTAATNQSLKFPRRPGSVDFGDGKDVDLEDVQIWDLFDAFRDVMDAIGKTPTDHEVIHDDTPLELYQEDVIDRLQREGAMSFARVFEGRTVRHEIVGLFLAVLELVRLQQIFAAQGKNFGEIEVQLNPNPPTEEELAELDAKIDAARVAAEPQQQEDPQDAPEDEFQDDEDIADDFPAD
ncbi:MAG: segregation/condensation protein A, partial [Phycisphaerae bacterium]|nr:segregation/condensation protein A [Phycisphaerae bacterium]